MHIRHLTGYALLALLTACASAPSAIAPVPTSASAAPMSADERVDAVIAEAWISDPARADELDSLAAWPTPEGATWLIASGKSSNTLVVYDASDGARLRSVGGPGTGPLQFDRPNGVAIHGDLLFVAERGNHRVQVLRLPDFAHVAMIGATELRVPYGLWLQETGPDVLELFVTDSFMADFRTRLLPPMDQLDQRVKRFEVRIDPDGALRSRALGAFGDTGEAGALRMVESIAGDSAHDRLLIADEDRRVGSTLRDYALDGRYRNHSLPPFRADAEGIALWACDAEEGYWIAVDQLRPTIFRVFDRRTLQPLKTFSGEVVANTDGLALYATGTPRFPAGALFALHDDRAIAAFDLRDVVRALGLSDRCVQ